MFIRLHHFVSGKEFFIPASHIVIIDGVEKEELVSSSTRDLLTKNEDKRTVKKSMTYVHTIITKGQNTLTFEVKETPEEVASLVNEMLHVTARAERAN